MGVLEKFSQYDYTEKRENKNKFMHALYKKIKKKRESKRSIKQQSRWNDADNQKKKINSKFHPSPTNLGCQKN